MKISFGQDIQSVTSSIGKKKAAVHTGNASLQQKDKLSIGLQARQLFKGQQQKNSMIESLMKQRESIQEMKSHLTERTMEKGGNLSSIKDQLQGFEEQMAEIDKQIAQAQTEERNGSVTNLNDEDSKEQTSEQAFFAQAGSLEQAKTLESMNRTLSREQATLKSQMKLDANRGVHSEFKENRLAKVNDQMTVVQEDLAEKVQQVVSKELLDEPMTVQDKVDELHEEKNEEQQDSLLNGLKEQDEASKASIDVRI